MQKNVYLFSGTFPEKKKKTVTKRKTRKEAWILQYKNIKLLYTNNMFS